MVRVRSPGFNMTRHLVHYERDCDPIMNAIIYYQRSYYTVIMNAIGWTFSSSSTRLRSLDLPVFPHPCLYAGNFNCRHADWGYDDNSQDVSAWLAGQVLIVLPSYIMPRTLPVFIPAAGTLAPIQI